MQSSLSQCCWIWTCVSVHVMCHKLSVILATTKITSNCSVSSGICCRSNFSHKGGILPSNHLNWFEWFTLTASQLYIVTLISWRTPEMNRGIPTYNITQPDNTITKSYNSVQLPYIRTWCSCVVLKCCLSEWTNAPDNVLVPIGRINRMVTCMTHCQR